MRFQLLAFGVVIAFLHCPSIVAEEWQVGVAQIDITPKHNMWMSGYGNRTRPAQGKLTDLRAKAIVLRDSGGRRVVLVTMDLVGIDRELSSTVCVRITERFGIPRSAIALSVSHTHTGPVVGSNLAAMFALDENQHRLIEEYSNDLKDKLVQVVGNALEDLKPADLSFGTGIATFAVNRRNNPESEVSTLRAAGKLKGPVDHSVPVLAIRDLEGGLRAVVFGYACHATTLDGYAWSGDWPGFAQIEFEKSHPGTLALFWAGCGADQNPLPRRRIDLAQQYGSRIAAAVDATVDAPMQPLTSCVTMAYKEIDLPFQSLPSRHQLERDATGDDVIARRAQLLLAKWNRHGGLSANYPYPVQCWQLGHELTWIFLGGEVVVDYALRLRQELDKTVWIAGYCNDVMAYIPNRRVLSEGGYEADDVSMACYAQPGTWDKCIEERIIDNVKALTSSVTESSPLTPRPSSP